MPRELETSQSDMGPDHARELVARILEFVASEPERLARFVRTSSFQPETAEQAARSPLFMLSVLDSVMKDALLLDALHRQERIGPALIELTRARLAFHIAAEVTRRSEGEAEISAVRARVQHQLRVLLHVARGR